MAKRSKSGDTFIKLSLDDSAVMKGLRKVQKRLGAIGGGLQRMGAIGVAAGGAIASAFILPVKAASDLEETMNKFNVVFGSSSDVVKKWGDEFASQIGRSKEQIARFMSNTQDLLVPLGMDPKAAENTSKQLTGLALDLASFNNMADDDVLRDLHAALTGSGEVMKKYGVVVSAASVNQQILNDGLDPKTATEAQKAMARLSLIMDGTTAAQGDAIRSSGGFANQIKRVQGVMSDLAAEVGSAVLPAVTFMVSKIADAVSIAVKWAANNKGLIATVAAIGAALFAAGGIITTVGLGVSLLSVALGGILALIGAILSPIGLLVVGLTGLATWFLTSTDAGGKMIETLSGGLGTLGTIASETMGGLANALASGDIAAAGEILWAALKLLWLEGTDSLRTKWTELTTGISSLWHITVSGIAKVWTKVSGIIERSWSHVTQFLADSADLMVMSWHMELNILVGLFEAAWATIRSIFTGEDLVAELKRIYKETAAAGEIIRNDAFGRVGERANAAEGKRNASTAAQEAVLDTLAEDLKRKLEGASKSEAEAIKRQREELEAARKKFADINREVGKAADAIREEAKAKAAPLALAAAGAKSSLSGGSSAGAFSAGALRGIIGNDTGDRTAKATERTVKVLERMEKKTGTGLQTG